MRHCANILIGQDLKPLAARLGEYVLKYGEAGAPLYFSAMTWTSTDGVTEVKKAVANTQPAAAFVSTMHDQYLTRLEPVKTLTGQDRDLDMRHFFTDLHQSTVTINNPGDSNSLLLMLYVPLYDEQACQEAVRIVAATSAIQSRYTVVVTALCENLGNIVSPELFRNITAEEEDRKRTVQKEMLRTLGELRLRQNTLEQILVMQNTNSNGFALNLDHDSLLRIIGELALICVEKYNTVFTQASIFDREHIVTAIGLSVMNLDKYYFENYLLRRAYLRIMEREDVTAEEVDLNKVAIIANACLARHQGLFSDFYAKSVTPLWRQEVAQEDIIAQIAKPLDTKFGEVFSDLTAYINDPHYSLPEKQAILAVILGYDDALLKGNLFTDQQLTLDNLDLEVADYFTKANNECVRIEHQEEPEKKDTIVYGPLKDLCADCEGNVQLPIERLQKLRNEIRQSTNYIREKNKELEEIDTMTQDAEKSMKRLTEDGFVVDGTVYRFDIRHEEVKFNETYEPKPVTEKSIDLREFFTKVKDQGQLGACTVFAIASIYEYILKYNELTDADLSESFVYYNVRHANGRDLEDTGSSFQDVIMSIGQQGICTEPLHPYSLPLSQEPSTEAYQDAKKRRITKALNVNISEHDIKSAIQEGYPVAVSLKIFDSFYTTKGFVERPTADQMAEADYGYHAMVVVGYTDETRHFVVRNSWGQRFGDKGYCYIPYSYLCDPELNRMACIVKEVDCSGEPVISVTGGTVGKKKTVQFNMSDAVIKAHVIRNLLNEEQLHLHDMQEEDSRLKIAYETLMQTLGKQSVRSKIQEEHQKVLNDRWAKLKQQRDDINETQRGEALRNFDSEAWKIKLKTLGCLAAIGLVWVAIASFCDDITDWLQSSWCWGFVGAFILTLIFLILYWWHTKSQRRKMELEFEEKSAELSSKMQKLQMQAAEEKMRMHVAGMIIDKLLTLRASLDKKFQGMKSYIGNLSLWYSEEQKKYETMEPLVKDPFIPLLSNSQLNRYFEDNSEVITQGMLLYEYFNGFRLDDDAIIAYKRHLKQSILEHIKSLLDDFTVFRHIFGTRTYPFLDKEYASASHLLPILDTKSDPFCQIRRSAVTMPQARFLFIHTDPAEEQAWKAAYPQYFNMPPLSASIASVFKIVGLRLQTLLPEEVILD